MGIIINRVHTTIFVNLFTLNSFTTYLYVYVARRHVSDLLVQLVDVFDIHRNRKVSIDR